MPDKTEYVLRLAVDRDDTPDPHEWLPQLDRRAALRLLGMTAIAGLAGCGSGTGVASAASDTSSSTSSGSSSSCAAQTLEGEEGPYFVDDSASGYMRSNILSNLDGSNTQKGVASHLLCMCTTRRIAAL